jgi:D-sedoheptulose 7-phosphate isomerase
MHAEDFLLETEHIAHAIDADKIETMAAALHNIKGRVYCIGIGGSLANCIHMAADLRKLCGIDAVAPSNIAELTAWANDEGWDYLFNGFMSGYTKDDAIFILSVGGGKQDVSTPIIEVLNNLPLKDWPTIFGIVGPDGGMTAREGDYVIRIPAPEGRVTPHTEAFQAVIFHCLVSHPLLQVRKTKW